MGVPLARRGLFESHTRMLVAVVGVALAIMLVLAMDGVFAAAMRQVTAYIDITPFDLVVSQEGVRNLHMTSSQFPLAALDRIKRVPGVAGADPILFTTAYVVYGDTRNLVYLIGFRNGQLGGPPASPDVPRVLGQDEIVIDKRVAAASGIEVGDKVSVLGRDFTVAGYVGGTVSVTNSVAYIRFEDFEGATGLRSTQSFALLRLHSASKADAVASLVRARVPGVTVQTRDEFAGSERRVISDMSTDILRIMTLIAFLIGIAVVALTVYSATLVKLREYGVLMALGARTRRLFAVVVAQAGISVALGLAVAVGLTAAIAAILSATDAPVGIQLEVASVTRVTVGSAVAAAVASVLPVVRVASIEPTEVFRR